MQEQVLSWIDGLRSTSTEIINECDQNLLQFSSDPSNFQCFIDIIKENTDFYIVNASLHILRSSLNKFTSDIPPEYAMELLSGILEEFSKNFDFNLIYAYKSLIKLLILLAGEENIPELLFNFILQIQDSNKIVSIILINLILKTTYLDDSDENPKLFLYQYSLDFLPEIASIENYEYRAYLLAFLLDNLAQLALLCDKRIEIDLIEPYIDLFKEQSIPLKTFRKLWESVAEICVYFDQFSRKDHFLIHLIRCTSSIPNPLYLCCSFFRFVPFFKEKSIPLSYIKFLISCELSVCVRFNSEITNFFFDKNVLKYAITYYSSPEEINDIFNHIYALIRKGIRSHYIHIVTYGYLIKKCHHVVDLDFHDIIQFFDEIFTNDSDQNYIFACLYGLGYIINSTYNNLKEILNYFFDRILACTLSDVPEIRFQSLSLLNNTYFDVSPENRVKVSNSLFENQSKYLENSPYEFFTIIIICLNFNLPIPESYYEQSINDILIPLVKEDLSYLKFLSGLMSSNEFWIEPFMGILEPFFDTQIDEEISKVVDGSLGRSNELECIINFFALLLDSYGVIFYNAASSYILKICSLFCKIDEINSELFIYLTKQFSCALKYITDVEENDKLTACLLNFLSQPYCSSFDAVCQILQQTICAYPPELINSTISQILQIIETNPDSDGPAAKSCFKILAGSVKNPNLNADQLNELSQFTRKYYNDFVLKEQVYTKFFYSLSDMMPNFPDFVDWLQYLFSNVELISKNRLFFDSFYQTCVFQYLCDIKILPSFELDEQIAQLTIQIFNEQNGLNDFKGRSILCMAFLMENNRSPIIIQFFKENFEGFIQYLKNEDCPFVSYSAALFLSAAIFLNDVEFDPEMLAFCCDKFPDENILEVNMFFIKYAVMIMDEDNNCPYAPHLELKILDAFFAYLKKSYQKTCQIQFGNLFDAMIQSFKVLAEKNHDYIQQKINELDDFPSSQRRIANILTPPENEQENN